MTDVLALEKLYTDVTARFVLDGTSAVNVFGWRESARVAEGNRCVWIPGDPSGSAGKDWSARNPGRNPRPIGTFDELFTVEIFAADDSEPENELRQYSAVRLLRDTWHRAVYLAAYGTFEIQSETWMIEKKERRHGAAMRVVCSIQSMVPDSMQDAAPVDAHAALEIDELDAVVTMTVHATDSP